MMLRSALSSLAVGTAVMIDTISAPTLSACARVMTAVAECENHDDQLLPDPLSASWNWSWLNDDVRN